MRRLALPLLASAILAAPSQSQQQAGRPETAREFEAKLGYRTGTISLRGGLATLRLDSTFRFVEHEGSRRIIEQAWGNPPGSAEGVLGMLIPAGLSPLTKEGWGIVITYDEDGFVDDAGAEAIDYHKMLRDMQQSVERENTERRDKGYATAQLIGWAAPPHYDRAAHKLYWAKELAFSDAPGHTLNYNIRVLGRRGVLVLNAVAGMDQLHAVERDMRSVLGFVEFNEGHRYSDFIAGSDRKAAYGIGGLILGAVAVKAGLFKVLWVGILALKKFLILGAVAVVAFFKKLFKGKQAEATTPTPRANG